MYCVYMYICACIILYAIGIIEKCFLSYSNIFLSLKEGRCQDAVVILVVRMILYASCTFSVLDAGCVVVLFTLAVSVAYICSVFDVCCTCRRFVRYLILPVLNVKNLPV